jgi:hypothetical protein
MPHQIRPSDHCLSSPQKHSGQAPSGVLPSFNPDSLLLFEAGQCRHSTECSYCGRPNSQRSLFVSLSASLLM